MNKNIKEVVILNNCLAFFIILEITLTRIRALPPEGGTFEQSESLEPHSMGLSTNRILVGLKLDPITTNFLSKGFF